MKLADWREKNGWTQQRLAEELGCTISTVWRYEQGKRDPEASVKERIFILTGGQVQPNDFYPLPLWRRALAVAQEALLGRAA